ncbi:MAG: hypothetical protein H6726_05410 [Sandaracinaceae bacterium]|nr:hypothetical protein [Myxococcales bacterium]MCB9657072.1 hypothetical protein [Sandaracinaceae bacterium]
MRGSLLAAVLLSGFGFACGCAGSTQPAHSTPPARAPLGEDRFACVPADATEEPSAAESAPASAVSATDMATVADGAVAPEREAPSTAAESHAPASEHTSLDWFEAQGRDLGALACALDATDCATAAALGDRVCDLARRICALATPSPHCAEAAQRCERARARIRGACPTAR